MGTISGARLRRALLAAAGATLAAGLLPLAPAQAADGDTVTVSGFVTGSDTDGAGVGTWLYSCNSPIYDASTCDWVGSTFGDFVPGQGFVGVGDFSVGVDSGDYLVADYATSNYLGGFYGNPDPVSLTQDTANVKMELRAKPELAVAAALATPYLVVGQENTIELKGDVPPDAEVSYSWYVWQDEGQEPHIAETPAYTPVASDSGQQWEAEVHVTAEGYRQADFTMSGKQPVFAQQPARLQGRITDADGAPIAGATVTPFDVTSEKWLAWSQYGAETRTDGYYDMVVPAGDYQLQVAVRTAEGENPDLRWVSTDPRGSESDGAEVVSPEAGELVNGLDVRWAALRASLSGHVLEGDRALEYASLSFYAAGRDTQPEQPTDLVNADDTGAFDDAAFPTGTYKVLVDYSDENGDQVEPRWIGGSDYASAETVTIDADTERDFTLPVMPELTLASPSTVSATSAKVGTPITVTAPGTVETDADVAVEYFWLVSGGEWGAVRAHGADATSYTPTNNDAGTDLELRVKYTVDGFKTYTESFDLGRVTGGTLAGATPRITGTVKVGSLLRAVPGSWTSGTKLAYQWFANNVAISGARGTTFEPTAAQAGKKITLTVTGSQAGFNTLARTSGATAAVAKGALTGATPKVTGKAKVGGTIKVVVGKWSTGTKTSIQWFANGKAVKGGTKSSLKLAKSLRGKSITVKVTGTKAGYTSLTRVSRAVKVS